MNDPRGNSDCTPVIVFSFCKQDVRVQIFCNSVVYINPFDPKVNTFMHIRYALW